MNGFYFESFYGTILILDSPSKFSDVDNFREECGHTRLSLIPTNDWKSKSKYIGFGDGAINIRNDNLVIVIPSVDMTGTFRCSLAMMGCGFYTPVFLFDFDDVHFFIKK